jgi:hypothetical protein
MNDTTQKLETLEDIKRMMERSSRFISLSGWSGISAGLCAGLGAGIASRRIDSYYQNEYLSAPVCRDCLKTDLLLIAFFVFAAAFLSASFFTLLKSRREGVTVWGNAARRLLWNTLLPMIAGGFLIWHLMDLKEYEPIPSTCLIFYGLALVNGSKYTQGEVRFLGYAEILLGILNLFLYRSGLVCWAIGFGAFHIIYGAAMWWKYDRV